MGVFHHHDDPPDWTPTAPIPTPRPTGPMSGPMAGGAAPPLRIAPTTPSSLATLPPPPNPGAMAAAEVASVVGVVDPGFDPNEFLGVADRNYRALRAAYRDGDLTPVRALLTPDLIDRFTQQLAYATTQGIRPQVITVDTLETTLLSGTVTPDAGVKLVVRYRVAGAIQDIDLATSHPIAGGPETWTETWTYRCDKPASSDTQQLCSVCHAPLESGALECRYCHTKVIIASTSVFVVTHLEVMG